MPNRHKTKAEVQIYRGEGFKATPRPLYSLGSDPLPTDDIGWQSNSNNFDQNITAV
jgi:hypothetical protein